MKCPKCGLVNRPNARRCDCGHGFLLTEEEPSRLSDAREDSYRLRIRRLRREEEPSRPSEAREDPATGPLAALVGAVMGGFGGGAIAWATLADTGGIVLRAVIWAVLEAIGGLVYWQVLGRQQQRALRWAARHQEKGGGLEEAIAGAWRRSWRLTVATAAWGALVGAVLGGMLGAVAGVLVGGTTARILLGLAGAVLGAAVGGARGAAFALRRTARTVAVRSAAGQVLGGRPVAAAAVGTVLGALLGGVSGVEGWAALWPGHEVLVALITAAVLAAVSGLAGWQLAS
jgi:hypothetical protein